MSVVLRASLLHFFRLVCYRQEVCKNSQCLKITKKSLLFQYCERFSFQVGTPIPTIFIGENQFLVSFNLKSGGIRVPTLKLENETFLIDFQTFKSHSKCLICKGTQGQSYQRAKLPKGNVAKGQSYQSRKWDFFDWFSNTVDGRWRQQCTTQ